MENSEHFDELLFFFLVLTSVHVALFESILCLELYQSANEVPNQELAESDGEPEVAWYTDERVPEEVIWY